MRAEIQLAAAAGLFAFAGAAHAQRIGDEIDRSGYHVFDGASWFVPLEEMNGPRGGETGPLVVYSSGIDPFRPLFSFQTSTRHNSIVDDFRGVRSGATDMFLTEFVYIGGAVGSPGNGGRRIFVEFFDTSGFLVDGFTWDLPTYQIGAWGLQIEPLVTQVLFDNDGFIQLTADRADNDPANATTLRWFYTDAVEVGMNTGGVPADSTPEGTIYTYRITGSIDIPAVPAAVPMVTVGLLALRRRR